MTVQRRLSKTTSTQRPTSAKSWKTVPECSLESSWSARLIGEPTVLVIRFINLTMLQSTT